MLDRPVDGVLVARLDVQLLGLVRKAFQPLLKFVPATLVFVEPEHVGEIGIRQPFPLIQQLHVGSV